MLGNFLFGHNSLCCYDEVLLFLIEKHLSRLQYLYIELSPAGGEMRLNSFVYIKASKIYHASCYNVGPIRIKKGGIFCMRWVFFSVWSVPLRSEWVLMYVYKSFSMSKLLPIESFLSIRNFIQ